MNVLTYICHRLRYTVGIAALTLCLSSESARSATVSEISEAPVFRLVGNAQEMPALVTGASIVPTVNLSGLSGEIKLKQAGKVLRDASGTGFSFQPAGMQNTHTAYLQFTGIGLGALFPDSGGLVSFELQSLYSFAARNGLPLYDYRWAFDATDTAGARFYFLTNTDNSTLQFSFCMGGKPLYYAIGSANADAMFGKGQKIRIGLSWTESTTSLFINGSMARSYPDVKPSLQWNSASRLIIGSAASGFYGLDDTLRNFEIAPANPFAIISAPIVFNVTETSASVTWKTNQPGTSSIAYGMDEAYGQTMPLPGAPKPVAENHTIAISGLKPGTAYKYIAKTISESAVTASSPAGASFVTKSAVDVPPPTSPPPPRPSGLAARAASTTEVIVSWSISPGVEGYTVYRDAVRLADVMGRTFHDTGLTPGRTYSYTVEAFDVFSQRSAPSLAARVPLPTENIPLSRALPGNAIGIRNLTREAGRQPFTISRVFKQGELASFPKARIDGISTLTQANVKSRWPDGSVKHAMLSFYAVLSSRASTVVDFINQSTCSCESGQVSIERMLSDYAFDPIFEISSTGGIKYIRGSDMLRNGHVQHWLKGPIVTQVILEDRSATLQYDVEFNGQKAFHPIIVATFHTDSTSAKIEYIAENGWVSRLQDIRYSVTLKNGGAVKYTRLNFDHTSRTRWRKVYWTSDEPIATHIDYNLRYLVASKALPNYDYDRRLNALGVHDSIYYGPQSECGRSTWDEIRNTSKTDIGGTAQVCAYLPAAGGRGDIGLIPLWHIRYLFAMGSDYLLAPRLSEAFIGNAEVSGALKIHVRESLTGRAYLNGESTDAFGHFVSLGARPTLTLKAVQTDAAPADMLLRVSVNGVRVPEGVGGIGAELAHFPDLAYVPYLITGDWYFLEELYATGSWTLGMAQYDKYRVRNAHINGVVLNDYPRGVAWGLRNLAHAAFLAPDDAPEKRYFTDKLRTNLAVLEGRHDVIEGVYHQPCTAPVFDRVTERSAWCYGYQLSSVRQNNPLRLWDLGITITPGGGYADGYDTSRVSASMAGWMWNYMYVVLGHIAELGFDSDRLLHAQLKFVLNVVAHPDSDARLLGNYTFPTKGAGGLPIQTMAEFKRAWTPEALLKIQARGFAVGTDGIHAYSHVAMAAASFLPGINDGTMSGQAAWDYLKANIRTDAFNYNPMWALVPRK